MTKGRKGGYVPEGFVLFGFVRVVGVGGGGGGAGRRGVGRVNRVRAWNRCCATLVAGHFLALEFELFGFALAFLCCFEFFILLIPPQGPISEC